jgi:nucleoid-associated protein YgaU
MGKLERAKIYVLNGDGTKPEDKETKDGIDVCFNPKEYSLEKSVSWDTEKAFSDAPHPEFTKPSAMTLSVTLQFDTYEDRVSVRQKYTKHIERLAMMRGQPKKEDKPTKDEKKKLAPPVVLFVWGKFIFRGVVDSLSQKFTMFLADGTPVRAEIALKLRNVLENFAEKDPVAAAGTSQRTYKVKQGDRLDMIAASMLGSPSRWVEIAVLNNIDDPADIEVGKVLNIPG